jgi:hypothetical protein
VYPTVRALLARNPREILNHGRTDADLCDRPGGRGRRPDQGRAGEQSLKRIESAGERASGGLKGLGRQAELLRTGIRTLGGALIGVTTVGGLAALVDRSISAADAIGKTADKIGVGVEALQELRFAAKASGVEQQTLDMRCSASPGARLRPRKAPARPRTRLRRWASRMGIWTMLRLSQRRSTRTREPAVP